MSVSLDEILESHRTRRPVVMGILNVTPDSFSDGGQFVAPEQAIEHARQMAGEGADIIDIGAESTRPGSTRIGPTEQLRRLQPLLPAVCRLGLPVSIDTTRADVARWALEAGATIINDVSAGREDPDMLPLAARAAAAMVLMHMRGRPASMQHAPRYHDVVAEVRQFLADRLVAAEQAGLDRRRCIVDPGIGFGKTVEHNLSLLAGTPALRELGVPVMIGASRKRFLGAVTGVEEPALRLPAGLAAVCATYLAGATLFRVHDVGPTRQALEVVRRLLAASSPTAR